MIGFRFVAQNDEATRCVPARDFNWLQKNMLVET
jgi:hypothetical protein